MKPSPESLEKEMHRLLRSLPERPPPAGFEARVLAEIGRRAHRPWWRRSYSSWPAALRAAFFFVSAAAAVGIIAIWGRFAADESGHLAVWRRIWGDLGLAGGALVGSIPAYLYYCAAAVIGACCVTLAGIGAAVYRTFYS